MDLATYLSTTAEGNYTAAIGNYSASKMCIRDRGAPKIKNMTWKIIPEGSSRTIALEAGEVDFVVEVEAMDGDRLKENSDLTVIEYNSTNVTWLMLNNEKPGLDNEAVRHAINTAIDKESVVTVAYNGMATPALSQMPMNFEGATEENADTYDVEKAKEWLDKSGAVSYTHLQRRNQRQYRHRHLW